jgi:hypothetical protein
MNRRAAILASAGATVTLALGGCGVSVARGGENAATHPSSGIFVSPTVGGNTISVVNSPTMTFQPPSSTPPSPLPAGLTSTESAIEPAVTGGCWENSHTGNLYGGYDQLFWWQGDCGDTIDMVTVELYPTVAKASSEAHHVVSKALLARYIDGAVIVDVYANAPLYVLSQLAGIKGLTPVPGYGT